MSRARHRTLLHDFLETLEADVRSSLGRYVEAPVSGSRKAAEAGQLVVMLTGERSVAEGIRSLLEPICHDAVCCGDVPNALLMKLATSAFLIPIVTALAEAVHFADQHGLDMQKLLSVLNGGQMASNISRIKAQKLGLRPLPMMRWACSCEREKRKRRISQ